MVYIFAQVCFYFVEKQLNHAPVAHLVEYRVVMREVLNNDSLQPDYHPGASNN